MGADGRPRRAFPATLKRKATHEDLERCRWGATHARRFTPGPWVHLIEHVETLRHTGLRGIVAKRGTRLTRPVHSQRG